MNNDTIFALSSGHGKSGVAVIRISGNALRDWACEFTGRKKIEARRAYFTNLTDEMGDLIDQCLVIYFAAPHSFTGTDVIEIQSHGAPAVLQKIFAFLSTRGARMARPGEFSRRAFDAGKMNLADVDGLAALLDAQTERQRRTAMRAYTGDSIQYAKWRTQMIEIAAYAAAILDYADDELPANIGEQCIQRARDLYNEINDALARYAAVRAIRGGFNITLAGAPNVGKSSLFNRIVGENRAIVSDTPGTTRDVVSAQLDIDGYLVNISDTAGLRDDTTDAIEKIGIEKTNDEIKNADLVIRVIDQSSEFRVQSSDNEIIVINKSDLCTGGARDGVIYTSALTGDGIDDLMDGIRRRMHALMDGAMDTISLNARTHELLSAAADNLNAACNAGTDYDILSENVRAAADAIGRILGAISAADVMDATFSQLCLGK